MSGMPDAEKDTALFEEVTEQLQRGHDQLSDEVGVVAATLSRCPVDEGLHGLIKLFIADFIRSHQAST